MFVVSKELEKQLAEIDQDVLFELEQLIAANPPAARAVVENALEQPLNQICQNLLFQKLLLQNHHRVKKEKKPGAFAAV